MATYAVQIVYEGLVEEYESGGVARLEVIVLGADHDARYDELEALATAYARSQEREEIELPQGLARLKFRGVRSLYQVELPAPPSPAQIAAFTLEIDPPGSIDGLFDGDFVHTLFDW